MHTAKLRFVFIVIVVKTSAFTLHFYTQIVFAPHGKHFRGSLRPVTGIALPPYVSAKGSFKENWCCGYFLI
jgi:hypothetical protein